MAAQSTAQKTAPEFSIVLLELTNHCNMCCDFCPDGIMNRVRGLMDVDLAFKVLDEVSEKKMAERIFLHLMGEPLLHPRLPEIARHIDARGLKLSLYTNSSLLTEKHAGRLLSMPIDNLTLSIQSIDAESFALRHAGRLNYGDYVAGIESFLRRKVEERHPGKVNLHYMVGNVKPGSPGDMLIDNREQAEEKVERWRGFFRELDPAGAAEISTPAVNLNDIEKSYPVYPDITIFMKAAHHWAGAKVREGFEFQPSATGFCPAINGGARAGTFAVLWDGTVTYCCNDYEGNLSLGDVKTQSLEEIFHAPKATAIRHGAAQGKLIHATCQRCMGKLIDLGTGRKVPKYKNLLTVVHLSKNYYNRHGFLQTAQKSIDYIKKSL